jgi:hypothetical protein
MRLTTPAVPMFFSLLCSCASAPAKPAPTPAPPKTAAAPIAPKSEAVPALGVKEPAREAPKLAAGQCVDSFDCVDTVGFPPPGHRWDCVAGKCNRTKLPSLGASEETGAQEADAATAGESKSAAKKSKTMHR